MVRNQGLSVYCQRVDTHFRYWSLMARVKKIIRVCDRCPTGQEQPVESTVTISLDKTRWKLELCVECGKRLEREMFSWGRLGQQLEEWVPGGAQFSDSYVEDSRRAAELRAKEAAAKPKPKPKVDLTVTAELDGRRWAFTEHSIARMTEQHIRAVDVLRVASNPEVTRLATPYDGGLATLTGRSEVHEGNGLKVVVDLINREILNMAPSEGKSRDH